MVKYSGQANTFRRIFMIVTKVSVTQWVLGNLETSWRGADFFVTLPQKNGEAYEQKENDKRGAGRVRLDRRHSAAGGQQPRPAAEGLRGKAGIGVS